MILSVQHIQSILIVVLFVIVHNNRRFAHVFSADSRSLDLGKQSASILILIIVHGRKTGNKFIPGTAVVVL